MQAVKTGKCAPLFYGSIRQEFPGQMLFRVLECIIDKMPSFVVT